MTHLQRIAVYGFSFLLLITVSLEVYATVDFGYIDTIHGRCTLPKVKQGWGGVSIPGREVYQFNSHYTPIHLKKAFNTSVFYQRSDTIPENPSAWTFVGQKEYAPLIVIVSGLFSPSYGDIPIFLAQLFYNRGYHVLVLPNPWSLEFINHAKEPMGNLKYEADALLEVVEQFKLDNQNFISQTQIVGYSYGGYLGARMIHQDVLNDTDLIDGTALLIGAPQNIVQSIRALDHAIDVVQPFVKTRSYFGDKGDINDKARICALDKKAKIIRGGFNEILDTKEAKRLEQVAQYFVVHYVFQHELKNRITNFDARDYASRPQLKSLRPKESDYIKPGVLYTTQGRMQLYKIWQEAVRKWESSLRFEKYFETYALTDLYQHVGGVDGKGKKATLKHFVIEANQFEDKKVMSILAKNDFLNENDGQYDEFEGAQTWLEAGGHIGFITNKAFQNKMFSLLGVE